MKAGRMIYDEIRGILIHNEIEVRGIEYFINEDSESTVEEANKLRDIVLFLAERYPDTIWGTSTKFNDPEDPQAWDYDSYELYIYEKDEFTSLITSYSAYEEPSYDNTHWGLFKKWVSKMNIFDDQLWEHENKPFYFDFEEKRFYGYADQMDVEELLDIFTDVLRRCPEIVEDSFFKHDPTRPAYTDEGYVDQTIWKFVLKDIVQEDNIFENSPLKTVTFITINGEESVALSKDNYGFNYGFRVYR